MNFLKYEAEKKKLQEMNLTPDEYEEGIKRLVEKLEREENARYLFREFTNFHSGKQAKINTKSAKRIIW